MSESVRRRESRLSVIIPGYNTSQAWWKRCVDSVLMAIGSEDEIIVVDDGSGDGLRVGVEQLKIDDERVRVVYKKNGGLSSARNAGMEIAQGEYVTFVDSDDEVLPEAFEGCLAQIKKTASDICIYGVRTVWVDDGLQKIDVCEDRAYGLLTPLDVYDLSKRCLMNYAWNKVYRTGFLRANQISFDLEGMPCEDIVYNLECVMAGAKWCSVDSVGYVYYRTRETLLSKYKRTGFVGIQRGAEAWRRFAKSCGKIEDAELQRWLTARGTLTDEMLMAMEWRNIWMPASPYSIAGRLRWLREHPSVGGVETYLKMAIYVFFRRFFYCRPVRRWHVRRLYPHAENISVR